MSHSRPGSIRNLVPIRPYDKALNGNGLCFQFAEIPENLPSQVFPQAFEKTVLKHEFKVVSLPRMSHYGEE